MFGLKQRHTYDELINIVRDGGEIKLELPNRDANIIRNSQKYQSLLHEHLNELEEAQNKVAKHNILQNEIKQQKGVGNHQINVKTYDMSKDDDDGDYETPGSNGNGNGNYLTPEPHSESDITETISSVTDEEERKKQDRLKRIAEPDTRGYISHSIEGKMLEERARVDTATREGSTKKDEYDTKMKEMMRAYNNYELGDNKEFIEDLATLHHRIKSFGQGGRYGRYDFEEDLIEERKRIKAGIKDLWEKYNEFKSVRSVLDPNYPTLHQIALDSVLKGKDIASAVQGAKDAGIIFQTPSSGSKDKPPGLVSTARPKGRPKKDPQPDAEPKPAPKPKGRPKKQT